MSMMSFVTSFVGAFMTSAVVSRPKMVEECKDDEIRKMKTEIVWLREANHKVVGALADERDRTIELNRQLAAAELASFTWRARAETAHAFYNGAQPMVGNPEQLEVRLLPENATFADRQAYICNCAPGRGEMFGRTTFER